MEAGTETMVERLLRAVNEHNLEALGDCFASDYRNETPAHPARGFTGRVQVRHNWEQIFAFVPDIKAEVVRSASDGPTVWTEWEMRGTRRDGSAHLMRGVVIFGLEDARASWARFYLEAVDGGPGDVNDAVRSAVVPDQGGAP